jgi:IS5 family transposase
LKRVSFDTTVQPKAITPPNDAKRLNQNREPLVKLARKEGITLQQSYSRKGSQTVLKAVRYAPTPDK